MFNSFARWTTKPPPGTDIDRTHPLCPDYCWPFLSPQGSAKSLTRSQKLALPNVESDIISGAIVPGGKYGLSVRHTATSNQTMLTPGVNSGGGSSLPIVDHIVGLTGNITILLAYRKTDTTARSATALGVGGSLGGPDICDIILPFSDGNVYWRYGGSTNGTSAIIIPAAGVTFGDDLWMFSTGPRGMEMWQNGKLLASNAANPTRTAAGYPFGWPAGTPNFSDLADVALVMTWRRQLPSAAVRQLSDNPWQVFETPSLVYIDTEVFIPGATIFSMPGSADVDFIGDELTSPATLSGSLAATGQATVNFTGSAKYIVNDISIKLLDGTWQSLL